MQHWTSNVIILLCVHKIRKKKSFQQSREGKGSKPQIIKILTINKLIMAEGIPSRPRTHALMYWMA